MADTDASDVVSSSAVSRDPVDERARLALEALQAHVPPHRANASAPELDELAADDRLPPWLVDLHGRLAARWPAFEHRPGLTVALLGLLGAIVLGVGAWWATGGGASGGGPPPTLAFTSTTAAPPPGATAPGGTSGGPSGPPASLVAHAAGAVHQPGVHRLEPGARVADLVAAAGGATADADLDRVNLAAPVADGERLYVPRVGQPDPPVVAGSDGGTSAAAADPGGSDAAGGAGSVDVNRATVAELDVLPGVGPTTAEAIVAHREANGPFRRLEDLLEVRGIGPSKLEGLRDHVTIG